MKTFSIDTLGCKVNQYETQQILHLLEQLGLDHIDTADKPDMVVVNTCCVTNTASAKSRQYIRKALKLSPDADIVVCGCLPLIETGQIPISGQKLHLVKNRTNLAQTLTQLVNGQALALDSQALQISQDSSIRPENTPKSKHKSPIFPKLSELTSFKGHTRAFLKIQDGCDGYCSYCIVPKTRPIVQSKSQQSILHEAQAIVNAGHKEIVITGIFLGAFGQPTVRRNKWPDNRNCEFANLLEKIAQIPNLHRIRLSSLEPGDVTVQLLDILCKYPNIMPHLHLPLQSGSPEILKKMCRQYTIDEFTKTADLVKSRLDRPAITTDIIVGFPGETDSDFQKTLDLARVVGFSKMHVFPFSPRQDTPAAKMPKPVHNETVKHRSQALRDLDNELGCQFRQQFIGQTATVLIEDTSSRLAGRCERYFMVSIENPTKNLKKNDLVKVTLTKNNKTDMTSRQSSVHS